MLSLKMSTTSRVRSSGSAFLEDEYHIRSEVIRQVLSLKMSTTSGVRSSGSAFLEDEYHIKSEAIRQCFP